MASPDKNVQKLVDIDAELRSIADAASRIYGVPRLAEPKNHGARDEFTEKLALAEQQRNIVAFLLSVIEAATAGAVKGGGE
jgi:hypothetical protein